MFLSFRLSLLVLNLITKRTDGHCRELRSSPNLGFGTQLLPVHLRKLTIEYFTPRLIHLCRFLGECVHIF
jgi:hypothetical protein